MDIRIKKKPWYRRYLYHIIGGTTLAALVIYATVMSLEPHKMKLSDTKEVLATARVDDFTEYIDVEGIVQPIMTVQVNTMEGGFVERIVAEDGAMLNAGDTILVLTNPELLRSIDDENDAWEDSERRYREQEIEMQQKSIVLRQQSLDANYQLASIEKSLQQSREEYRMGIKSKAELEVAEKNYEYQKKKALLQLESLGHDSVSARLMREMAVANRQASDKKRARSAARTRNLVVRAPVAGQLSFLGVTPGQQVGSGVKVGEIKIMTQFKIKVSLNEFYIDRIANGLPASVKYDYLGEQDRQQRWEGGVQHPAPGRKPTGAVEDPIRPDRCAERGAPGILHPHHGHCGGWAGEVPDISAAGQAAEGSGRLYDGFGRVKGKRGC